LDDPSKADAFSGKAPSSSPGNRDRLEENPKHVGKPQAGTKKPDIPFLQGVREAREFLLSIHGLEQYAIDR